MNNPFKNILSKFTSKGLPGMGGVEEVVGVDIGASSIKLVELKKRGGKAVLETYSTLALGPYANLDVGAITNLSSELLIKALNDAFTQGTITTRNAALSIPASASLIFTVDLPGNLSEKDLPTVVPTEARKYIPVPVSEVTLDYWVIPHQQQGFYEESVGSTPVQAKTEVLAAAIHNDTLSKYREITQAAGVSADVFEIEAFSAIRSTFSHELSAVLLIDMGAAKTKLSVVEYGIVRTFHIVNKASADISTNIAKSLNIPFAKAEEIKRAVGITGTGADQAASDIAKLTVEYILSETETVVQNFERKYNKPVSKVILCGAGVLLPGFRERAQEVFKVEVFLGNPFDKVEVPQFVAGVLAETGPEFATALGLALRKLG